MRPRSARMAAFALAAASAVGGCAAPRASQGPSTSARADGAGALVGNQGGSWEVVLPGGSTSARLVSGAEYSRRDGDLAAGGPGLIQDSYWPDPAPRLQHLRRYWLTDDPRAVHYHGRWPHAYAPRPSRYWRW